MRALHLTLHYVTCIRYITLCYKMLHMLQACYVNLLCYFTLCFVTSHYVMVQYVTLHGFVSL